jgi:DNA ligase (NAD+)
MSHSSTSMSILSIEDARRVPISTLAAFYLKCKERFFDTGNPLVDDDVFDEIEDILKQRSPNHKALKVVGTAKNISVSSGKCTLPYWMGSQDKIYPDKAGEKAFASWRQYIREHFDTNVTFSASVKLDGLSIILVVEPHRVHLLSRGNGSVAQDWTHHMPYITSLQKPIQQLQDVVRTDHAQKRIVIRAEAVMPRQTFHKHHKRENWNKTSRNVVSGLLNAKTSNVKHLAFVDVVAYEVIEPSNLSPPQQLQWLHKYRMHNVATSLGKPCNVTKLPVDFVLSDLEPLFWRFREHSPYDNDGVVVTVNAPYVHNEDDNPNYSFAFKIKVNDATQIGKTMVTGVEWNVSRHGLWKPTIVVEPVTIGGVRIVRATGFNANYIQTHSIGPGARVKIRRCGDVIPNVVAVLSPSTSCSMPPQTISKWGTSGIDLELSPPCPSVWCNLPKTSCEIERLAYNACRLEQLTHFLQALHIPHISRKTVAKCIEHGYTDPFKLLSIDSSTLSTWDGFASKSSLSLMHAFDRSKSTTSAIQWVIAADAFGKGIGERKLKQLAQVLPELFSPDTTKTRDELRTLLLQVPGFQQKTVNVLLDARPGYLQYWHKVSQFCGKHTPLWTQNQTSIVSPQSGPLSGTVIRFTGFRDASLASALAQKGAEIVDGSMNKRVNTVVWDDTRGKSKNTKVTLAEQKGLTVWTRSHARQEAGV